MSSFNKVILIGRLTRDPELKFTQKGTAVSRLSMAVNRKWKTESGEQREEVTFVEVDCFGRQAETVAQYLKKGRPVMVEGRLKLDSWEDKTTGAKRSRLGVAMESFVFLDAGNGKSEGTPAPAARSSRAPAPPNPDPNDDLGADDNVPF